MSVSTTFDLLLRGGRVIDPASHIDGMKDRPRSATARLRRFRRTFCRPVPRRLLIGDGRTRAARTDRYPRACLSICPGTVRRERRHRGASNPGSQPWSIREARPA